MKSRDGRKKEALEEAVALFEANAQHMGDDWYAAELAAQQVFEEMQRGEMDGFEDLKGGWAEGDEHYISILSHLARLHISADKPMPNVLKGFVAMRLLIEPMPIPNVVDGKLAGWKPMKVKRGQKRRQNLGRDNVLINLTRHIKQKYGYDAVRGVDKRTPDDPPSAASIVAEAFKIAGIRTSRSSGKRSQKSSIDESTVSNLWGKRNKKFDGASPVAKTMRHSKPRWTMPYACLGISSTRTHN